MGHWWDGTEDGSPETWRSPSRHWDRDRGSYPCEHTCIPVCMGQHAGPHTQGPNSASKVRCTEGLGRSDKMGWASCS